MNTSPQPPQFKRRTIFIKKNLQIRYMMLIILSVLCGLAIMTFELTATLDELFDNYPVLMQPLYDQFLPLAAGFAYKIAIYLLLVIIISAILSHKMAGPVYRIEQTCKDIAKGDFSQRVRLRQGDQFTELQDEFNKMMDRVEAEINKNKQQ
ncbi:HAMP domain-containing protein [Candidatus Avelusimicrobium fimicolum]|uniref:HAMP domain-containing protein n=1 Tax=Candidatus Avelusimicrobium fimicolum TaxID=3416216 RepID=UPI003D0D9EE9